MGKIRSICLFGVFSPVLSYFSLSEKGLSKVKHTITHKMITEPIFTIFEIFSVIPVLRLPNRIVSRIS